MIGRLIGIGLLPGLFLALCVSMTPRAGAAPAVEQAPETYSCALTAGSHELLFSGYTVSTPRREFCQDIPVTGRSVLTVDDISRELRDMPVEIRVIRDTGSAEAGGDLSSVTLAHLPARKYPTGTVTFPVDFDKPGAYLVLVTVTDEHGWIDRGRLQLSVGETTAKEIALYALMGFALVGAGGIAGRIFVRRRQRGKT